MVQRGYPVLVIMNMLFAKTEHETRNMLRVMHKGGEKN